VSSFIPGKFQDSIWITRRPIPSTAFRTSYSPIILPIDAIQPEALTESRNKPQTLQNFTRIMSYHQTKRYTPIFHERCLVVSDYTRKYFNRVAHFSKLYYHTQFKNPTYFTGNSGTPTTNVHTAVTLKLLVGGHYKLTYEDGLASCDKMLIRNLIKICNFILILLGTHTRT
jgi:hypothetical protein